MGKISPHGDFLDFPGVTLISLTQHQDSNLWKRLFQLLKSTPLINDYYSLLPCSSYHMTINNLYNKESEKMQSESEWNNFISNNLWFFQMLNYYLEKTPFTPQIMISNHIVTEWVLQLQFCLPPQQVSAINNLTMHFKLENTFPNNFHMTLAYQKPNKILRPEEHKEIKEFVLREVKKIFAEKELQLSPPKLCYFRDMTKFTLWDGTYNPFSKNAEQAVCVQTNPQLEEEENNTTPSSSFKRRF